MWNTFEIKTQNNSDQIFIIYCDVYVCVLNLAYSKPLNANIQSPHLRTSCLDMYCYCTVLGGLYCIGGGVVDLSGLLHIFLQMDASKYLVSILYSMKMQASYINRC